MKVPTIHEGADARKIEEKYLTGQIRKGSWKVEENQMIKKQNALLQKVIATFGKVSGALSIWKEWLNDIRRIATFIQNVAGWVVLIGKNMAQISNGISNPVVAGIINWLIRILICGGCLVGVGILLAFIEIKIAGLYKKYCWDMITIMVILVSMAIAIYFADWIRTILPVNLLFLLLLVQVIYVVIRWYVKGWRETRGYY